MADVMAEIMDRITSQLARVSPGGVSACPIDGCDFQVEVPAPWLRSEFVGSSLRIRQGGVDPASVEDTLSAHFATHGPVDYLRTIQRLNGELQRVTAQTEGDTQ